MIVTEYMDIDKPLMLSEKEIAEINEAAKHPIAFDEDCPPMTESQIRRAMEYLKNRRKVAV